MPNHLFSSWTKPNDCPSCIPTRSIRSATDASATTQGASTDQTHDDDWGAGAGAVMPTGDEAEAGAEAAICERGGGGRQRQARWHRVIEEKVDNLRSSCHRST